MPLVIQGCNNRVMAQSLYNVQVDMLKGEGLAKPMSKDKIFLPMMVQMVKVGEESGSLDSSLSAVAQNYETEAQDKTRALVAMIQPIMTIVIAGIVGLIAMSMVSAMYSIYGQAF
jgi:type IV pilus assembly protein PilC